MVGSRVWRRGGEVSVKQVQATTRTKVVFYSRLDSVLGGSFKYHNVFARLSRLSQLSQSSRSRSHWFDWVEGVLLKALTEFVHLVLISSVFSFTVFYGMFKSRSLLTVQMLPTQNFLIWTENLIEIRFSIDIFSGKNAEFLCMGKCYGIWLLL